MGSIVHIICSDTARNGKTLLARVLADLSSLRREGSPVIFDTDISGNGIINYFPNETKNIDLSRVGDQVTLFDTMMELNEFPGGEREVGRPPDFVVDVAASELWRFFDLFRDIGFERGAKEAHLDVRVYYMISWTLQSLQSSERVHAFVAKSRFFAVRNMAVQAFAFTPLPHEAALVPDIDISLFLNALSPAVFGMISEKTFSFARFISGEYKNMRPHARTEILQFLEEVHNRTNSRAAN